MGRSLIPLLVVDLFLQQALAPGDTDAGDGIADNVQRGDEHLDGTVDGQNEGVGQQSAVVDEAHAGQDGEEDDGTCTGEYDAGV